jgi:hypothetical protein
MVVTSPCRDMRKRMKLANWSAIATYVATRRVSYLVTSHRLTHLVFHADELSGNDEARPQ